ncbi:hypothetical protein PHYSODRAFT_254554 [Phytophthora sojae]|uniref:Uncharacterized protein n=1 Tax=Phytophthora sojae (strain P6497) TaxID=1094619 RepID=G4ZEP7_PHYSP|nr:hypothetical protein PHYSODRAFT_254554 [Phytophthora sojae]EGZ16570.1 hypothetical protein PHYSODRAFT_254554 [Phytophthora sojae]|eukprot:XP_009525628.1 hypothetical protein PHYSODRAFT_254554 [Phytophthora sojae]
MTHAAPRSPAPRPARATDGSTVEAEAPAFSPSSSLSAAAPRHARPREPPPLERAVVSRTRFHITLPSPPSPSKAAAGGGEADQRGWSSPHGEPYRPLGRPELKLKFSPQLVYGVSPMMQNAHRMRAIEGSGGAGGSNMGGSANSGSEKDKELREPSSCTTTGGTGAPLTTLVDQFVTSLTSRRRPLDERQVKLAHRLQANVGGFSPEKVRGLHRRKPQLQEQDHEPTGGEHSYYNSPRGDTSYQLLREAIDEGTSRLRSSRNGTSFLQKLPPSDLHGLQELQEQYLRARTKTAQLLSRGSGGGTRTSPRVLVGSKTYNDEATTTHRAQVNRNDGTSQGHSESEDGGAPCAHLTDVYRR